jgi:hypothetical protein
MLCSNEYEYLKTIVFSQLPNYAGYSAGSYSKSAIYTLCVSKQYEDMRYNIERDIKDGGIYATF